MYRTLLGRTGLRPIQVRAELPRYAWLAVPVYRAELARVQPRVELPKKKRSY